MPGKTYLKSDLGASILRALTHFAEKVKGLEGLNDLYRHAAPGGEAGFFGRVMAALDLSIVDSQDLNKVPRGGRLIVMAAFPAAPLDSLALMTALEGIRPDIKVLAPRELGWVPEARSRMIPLDNFRRGLGRNLAAIRSSLAHLRQGGALVLFPWPAGFPAVGRATQNGVWARVICMLLRMSGASVLPALVQGLGKDGEMEDPSMGARRLTLALGPLLRTPGLGAFLRDQDLLDYLKLNAWRLREGCRQAHYLGQKSESSTWDLGLDLDEISDWAAEQREEGVLAML